MVLPKLKLKVNELLVERSAMVEREKIHLKEMDRI